MTKRKATKKKLVIKKAKFGVVQTLINTMQGLSTGSMNAKTANSIAGQSRELCRIAKVRLDYARFNGTKVKNMLPS